MVKCNVVKVTFMKKKKKKKFNYIALNKKNTKCYGKYDSAVLSPKRSKKQIW